MYSVSCLCGTLRSLFVGKSTEEFVALIQHLEGAKVLAIFYMIIKICKQFGMSVHEYIDSKSSVLEKN